MSLMHKERSKALYDFLSWCHAEQYVGLDDDMSDDCNDWINGLNDSQVNALVLETFRDGI